VSRSATSSERQGNGISEQQYAPKTPPTRTTALAALILAGASAGVSVAAGLGQRPNARIVGRVRVCNVPDHCLTRVFQVSATDAAGRLVGRATTSGPDNRYRLLVPARHYSLLARSRGLRCTGSTTAVANRTVTANIICLVP